MPLVNFTPHTIVVRIPNFPDKTFPPDENGRVARVSTIEKEEKPYYFSSEEGCQVPTISRQMGSVEIPTLEDGEYAIVSSMVLDAAKAQNHPMLSRLFAPDSGPTAIREKGQVVAVTRLVRA